MCAKDNEILTFQEGILGFEEIRQYELLFPEEESPFLYLKAVGRTHPCFVVCDPICFVPDYRVDYDKKLLALLKADSADDLRCLAIASIPSSVADMTVNLKSPVVFNIKNMTACQYVTDNPIYPVKHLIFKMNGTVG